MALQNSKPKENDKVVRGGLSFRTRLILATIVITFLSAVAMSLYVFSRTQQMSTSLLQQFDASVRQQAETTLQKTSATEVEILNFFFASLRKEVVDYGATSGKMLSHESALNTGAYWDANTSLFRLQNGSWDNLNTDDMSIFIPARVELSPSLISELNTLVNLNFVAPILLASNPDTVAVYFGGLSGETLYYPNIDLASLVPADFDVLQRPWFVDASPSSNPEKQAVWSDPYLDAASNGLIITISVPVLDKLGNFRGVEAIDVQLNRITEIVSNIKVGQTGHAFLLDNEKRLIAMPQASYNDFGITPDVYPLGTILDQDLLSTKISPELAAVVDKMSAGSNGLETISVNGVENFIIYNSIPEVGYSLAIIVPTEELLSGATAARQQIAQSTQSSMFLGLGLVIIIFLLSSLAAWFFGNRMMKPLSELTKAANEISEGNLNATARVEGKDEIGVLAATFNDMTSKLRESLNTLEQRVADRTQSLELAAEVGRSVSQVRALDIMLRDAVELIRARFDLYYVQIYLTDSSRSNLVLKSGTGSVGEELVNRGHRLPMRSTSINGRAAIEKISAVVSDTESSPSFKPNPLLPDTRSEMAIPLLIGDRVVGVLDLQSRIAGSLNDEMLPAFEALAGQLAITIENASLLEEAQKARLEEQVQTERITRANWVDFLDAVHEPEAIGFVFENDKVTPLENPEAGSLVDPTHALVAPIAVSGASLGDLVVELEESTPIARADELVASVARQVAQQIENLRLLENAERSRAEAELASRRITREGWKDFMEEKGAERIGYLYNLTDVRPITSDIKPIEQNKGVALPVKVRDEAIGELVVQGVEEDDNQARELISAVAERLGAHIESLRQQGQTQLALEQTERLSAASLRLSQAGDLQDMLAVVQETLSIQSINRLVLGVYEYNASNELEEMTVVANWWSGIGHEPTEIGRRHNIELLKALPYFTSPTPIFSTDMFTDERVFGLMLEICQQQNIRGMASMPLFIGNRQIGILLLETEEPYAFTQANIQLFNAMAPQVATVLENRRQFERAQKQAERQSTLNVISQKIQSATSVEAVLQIAARELGHALGAPRTIAQLSVKDKK